MPRKPGAGKKGSGKRLIHKAGGSMKDLKTWRSLSKATRQTIKGSAKSAAKSSTTKYDIKRTLKSIRAGRRAKGAAGTTGAMRTLSKPMSKQLPAKGSRTVRTAGPQRSAKGAKGRAKAYGRMAKRGL